MGGRAQGQEGKFPCELLQDWLSICEQTQVVGMGIGLKDGAPFIMAMIGNRAAMGLSGMYPSLTRTRNMGGKGIH